MIMVLGLVSVALFLASICSIVILAIQKKSIKRPLFSAFVWLVLLVFCVSYPSEDAGEAASSGSSGQVSTEDPTSSEPTAITFSGKTYTAEYLECWDAAEVNGCFYIKVKISNTGDKECTYLLDDVYVDDKHCLSGSGLPITALPSKNVNASFIVFCETPLDEVSKVEFKLKVMDSSDFSEIETSDMITVTPSD